MAKYDMTALMHCDLLDVVGAVQSFPGREEFWVALTKLCGNARQYLRSYTPSVVIYEDETRRVFLEELREVQSLLSDLKVINIPAILGNIQEAVARKDESTLTDLLRVFFAEMDILRQAITDTMVPERNTSSIKPNAKPVVMVIDDMPELLTGVAEMLLETYRVIALPNARSAIKALETQTPSLFILDIEMPDINGYELAKYIRSLARFKTTPILFLSGKGTREHVLAAMLHGGNDYLLKPIGKSELLKKVKQYLASGS
ncbi:MAG: response regulator [Oscillospiraceae bacterium]|jgi:CheY-like chemotaxis protein|nr:response regulator [Oscillospiraceae bacterium]